MNTGKTLITNGFGTISLNGICSPGSEIIVRVNNIKVFAGKLDPELILGGTLAYSNQRHLTSFDIKLDTSKHYDNYKIICTKGNVDIGAVHEHFHKDILKTATPAECCTIYQNRLAEIPVTDAQYSFYYKAENDMLLNKRNAKINDHKIIYDQDTGSIAGWLYKLEKDDVLTFEMDSFTPVDSMSFIANAQPGEEYFMKERR